MTLYTTSDWQTAHDILEKYNVRYVYIGGTERNYAAVNEEKFAQHLKLAFQKGNVSIYEMP